MSELIKNIFFASKYGIKTLYYANTNTDTSEEEQGCAGGACSV
jgi:hypothetical protein